MIKRKSVLKNVILSVIASLIFFGIVVSLMIFVAFPLLELLVAVIGKIAVLVLLILLVVTLMSTQVYKEIKHNQRCI